MDSEKTHSEYFVVSREPSISETLSEFLNQATDNRRHYFHINSGSCQLLRTFGPNVPKVTTYPSPSSNLIQFASVDFLFTKFKHDFDSISFIESNMSFEFLPAKRQMVA